MKIIRNLVEKKIENEHTFLLSAKREYALQEHISAYLHCLVFLGLGDSHLEEKKVLWKRFYSASMEEKSAIYQKLLRFKPEEDDVILKALSRIEEIREEGLEEGSKYRPFTWGMRSYEWSADE